VFRRMLSPDFIAVLRSSVIFSVKVIQISPQQQKKDNSSFLELPPDEFFSE